MRNFPSKKFYTKLMGIVMFAASMLSVFPITTFAQTITDGFTFAVASSSSDQSIGTHFHSNTGGSFGNPAGMAEVGRFGTEEVRGLSEYNISTLTPVASAFVTFDVNRLGGLFMGTNDFPFTGTIQIVAYVGNNTEDVSDYQAASFATIGTFSTVGLAVGNTLSFPITAALNTAIGNSNTSFGIRLAAVPLNTNGGALTFNNFRLTADSQCTVPGGCGEPPVTGTAIPTLSEWALLLMGLVLGGLVWRQSRRNGRMSA